MIMACLIRLEIRSHSHQESDYRVHGQGAGRAVLSETSVQPDFKNPLPTVMTKSFENDSNIGFQKLSYFSFYDGNLL